MKICQASYCVLFVAWLLASTEICAAETVKFECLVLSEEFHSEGAHFADFDLDGHNDIVSGPFWYAGPNFRERFRYMPGDRFSIKAYSGHFFSYTYDFNADTRPDILVVGMPGEPAYWYENPGDSVTSWRRHHVLDDCGNESPLLTDLTGDGRPELVCVHGGAFGYARPDPEKPTDSWQFKPVSKNRGLGKFTHGLGVGDVDGDGRKDVLETTGWHQQSFDDQPFAFRPQKLAEAGGAQMFAYDFDGDGDNDIVSVQNAHAWGLSWFERRGSSDDFLWVPHPILTDNASDNRFDLSISQMHGLALADIDGDGIKDIVTGKRFFAHGGGDPGAFQLPVLYWFRTTRIPGGRVEFVPHLIHPRVGVGTQLTTGDIDQDGRVDIVVGNKLGTYVLLNKRLNDSQVSTRQKVSQVGTSDFSLGVRKVGPKSPDEELKTFVLPEGFSARLFAAEPDIAKPLNMAFDARGRLWITNTLEYPYPVEVGKPGRDSIKILEDTNNDGRADVITTFADGLNIPMGLYPYMDGVVCFSIPNIWFLRDTDGDGKCDKREVLYGPFDHTRDTHGMCNAFTRGFDGWLYACHGFNNQSVVAGTDGNTVTLHSGNTFRFRLDGSRIEHFTHGQVNPFGMCYDARGDLLTADCHTKPVTLLMRGGHYESFGKPHDGLGFVPDVMEHLHGSTAIGGIVITPESWPAALRNNALGGNVMTSRINRNSLIYTESSVRAQEESDFLISGDSWFRPVDLQIGPDGALYVADFYNRIIGHYEVPLEHAGRDRTSGRIWRITYDNQLSGRDAEVVSPRLQDSDLLHLKPRDLVERFKSDNHTLRMLAADRLVDFYGKQAIPALVAGLSGSLEQQRLHCLRALSRLNAVSAANFEQAVRDPSPLVRAHAQQALGQRSTDHSDSSKLLKVGLKDENALVRRAAAHSCVQHRNTDLAVSLLESFKLSGENDPHLRHAIRIALKHQLLNERVFVSVANSISPENVGLLGGICLAVPTEPSANFIVDHIDRLAHSEVIPIAHYVQHASRYVSADAIPALVRQIRKRFPGNEDLQLQLLNSIADGLRRRDMPIPKLVKAWAFDLASNLWEFDQSISPITWEERPIAGEVKQISATWLASTKRDCEDGRAGASLWSSFPNGEQKTGAYRSSRFKLGPQFGFYIAGHDGYPNQELQGRNRVQLRNSVSHEILHTWSPPRQDTAAFRNWNSGAHAGEDVYVELIDGDASEAYAWLAVGRFTVEGLNPNSLTKNRKSANQLVADFSLIKFRAPLIRLLRNNSIDLQTRMFAAEAIASLSSGGFRNAIVESMKLKELPDEFVDQASQLVALESIDSRDAEAYLTSVLKFASLPVQQDVVVKLASDRKTIGTVLRLAEAGQVSARLFNSPLVKVQLLAVASNKQKLQIEKLSSTTNDEHDAVPLAIQAQKTHFMQAKGTVAAGKAVFAKHCAVCHQVAGQGHQVGPNLDGIGNRGLNRLIEDTLAPNRNVDLAFRATTIITKDGLAISGLVRSVDGATMTIVDSKAETIQIHVASIEEQHASGLSPMPSNFHEQFNKDQFVDLMTYLLSLTK